VRYRDADVHALWLDNRLSKSIALSASRRVSEDAPVVELVNVILLSANRKSASHFRIRRDGARSLVELLIDGATHEELVLPLALHAPVIRRLSVMASLPSYAQGQASEGFIVLQLGGESQLAFAIRVQGHGDNLEAWLRPVSADEVR